MPPFGAAFFCQFKSKSIINIGREIISALAELYLDYIQKIILYLHLINLSLQYAYTIIATYILYINYSPLRLRRIRLVRAAICFANTPHDSLLHTVMINVLHVGVLFTYMYCAVIIFLKKLLLYGYRCCY